MLVDRKIHGNILSLLYTHFSQGITTGNFTPT